MLTLEQVKIKSNAKLSGLHPVVRQAAERLIELSYARGVPIVITQGLRTIAEQDALYAQGRTKPGLIVTNARGGYSNHNFGVAIDFALLLPDGRSVSWDTLRDGDFDRIADWNEVVEEAKKLGFEWGGDWKTFKDLPHLEMTFGLTTAQYRAGQKPTETAMAKAIAKINRKDEVAMTAEEKKRFDALKDTVEALTRELKELQGKASMPIPKWADAAVKAAHQAGLIDTMDGGSMDFYRLITILHRGGLLITRGDK
ncbi:M15 family metallopeptidase [Paenibacillus vini]|uniref:M15 family metallopeptidase n=1 Tax=Paenibacillus vini TaxID=1476024 RepID=UPI0025B711E1|nr:M15 family metallopeptidase [Paenibacillus vini]MDN4069925.1 M15 family metallopeptidase [Paenibacillus vini]